MGLLDNILTPDGGDWGGAPWRILHLVGYTKPDALKDLGKRLKTLSRLGVNNILLAVDFEFNYQCDPDLRRGEGYIGKEEAQAFVELARQHDINVIPQFHCISHQSWNEHTFPLLTKYPQFDVTPGQYPDNEGIESREWDPTNPELYPILFAIFDELIEAFDSKAFHIGMDEIFLLGSRKAVYKKDMDCAEAFAEGINRLYQHLNGERQQEVMMWGDRLIDGKAHPLGISFSSRDGLSEAIRSIPKEMIICDWQMERRKDYETMAEFVEEGFRVLPVSWKDTGAIEDSLRYSTLINSPNILGRIFTTWREEQGRPDQYSPLHEGVKLIKMYNDGKK
ncbi:family 20 glycosylhydrolase [Parendozoicomonas haliclonae]|uniref:beta-N-acetylhexosaminidase n=1 Tax=Parendozoicomonas haliclonae TaxID=1960125 RepID=A0A1X7AIW7_9GAMM|nr:family 20 glycosylhydrolase [Parendozoicomonas haliclonae]SMA39670.1 Glycosyl hydrolase family 20, catalytic domain [Parendozoicomonas haliclonae]